MLTSKCASRHNGVLFFDIATSKKMNRRWGVLYILNHFDLDMCFAPQRRALFQHRNFKKWSENGVLYTFWLRNVLRATTACTFSTSQLPKVVQMWGVLWHFENFDFEMCFAPQRRAIVHLSSGQLAPHPLLFSEPTFNLPSHESLEKTRCFATFLHFRPHESSFFFPSLCWLFPSLLFICPYCRKFDF